MNRHVFLSCICLIILITLVAVPVIAATVSCPSSCSCLLPAEAKKLSYPGYCSGKQAVCGYDTQKNEKYCYTKPVTTTTMPPLILSARTFATTTPATVPPQKCASGCTCLSTAAGKGNGLLYCGGKQTLCGYDTDKTPLYCFARATTPATTPTLVILPTGLHVITTTTTPVPALPGPTVPCGEGCSCLAADKADALGLQRCSGSSQPCGYDPLGRPMSCYVADRATRVSPAPTGTTAIPATWRTLVPDVLPTTKSVLAQAPMDTFFAPIVSFFTSLFGAPPASSTPPQSSSLAPVPCSGIMTNVLTDPNNCGGCGAVCGSGSCIAGRCRDTSDYVTACGPGAVTCDGACTYLLSDDNNCGTCGIICDSGLSCCGGQCVDRVRDRENCGICGRGCLTNQTCCTYKCVDTSQDRLNCGECRHRCPSGYTCSAGGCIDTTGDELNCGGRGMRCAYDEDCCSSRCVNTAADNNNCGACGQTCISPEVCYNGECVETTSDEYNCGGHNIVCAQGETCCSGECINLALDNDSHCGGCGHTCLNGAKCCNGSCWFLDQSEENCGACGVTCDEYHLCCDGVCVRKGDNHCGSCHNSCGSCQECDDGSCETTFFSVIGCITP